MKTGNLDDDMNQTIINSTTDPMLIDDNVMFKAVAVASDDLEEKTF